MRLERTGRFIRQFQHLIKENHQIAAQIERTLRHLKAFPPAHPSLRMKRVRGTDGVFECSVNMDVRITFEFSDERTVLLRNIDHHDRALKRY